MGASSDTPSHYQGEQMLSELRSIRFSLTSLKGGLLLAEFFVLYLGIFTVIILSSRG